MIGILTEKPSARRNFAKALGGESGTFNGEKYTLVAARGHLYEFAKPNDQVNDALKGVYSSWKVENLPWNEKDFKWKYDKKPDVSKELKQIKDVLSKCDEIVIATDVDPTGEGYLLAAEILQELNLTVRKKLSRMYFMDEAPASIQKAFKERKVIPVLEKDKEYLMSYYRTRWDFLSMQWTRISLAYGDGKTIIRQGRLKSAMVKIVGDQLKAIAEYKPIPFFQNKFKDENGIIYSSKDEQIYDSKDKVPNNYTDSNVIVDSKEMKKTAPPKLLDLASLSARLAPKGFKSKEVLDTYQKMYEAQVVSYPRTEDKVITPEQFNELLPKVDKIASVVGVDKSLLTHRVARSTHVKTGGAHGANRPGPNVPKDLDSLTTYGRCAPLIYEILALNYLAILAEDYEYEYQKGHLEKYPSFLGTASVPKKMGWKSVFDDEADASEDENAKGLGTLAKPFVYEGVNPKPQTPTMKWLMKQLEKYDVGTGATRTSTYADVTNERSKNPLLKDSRGKISMAEAGDMSYHLLPNTHIGSLDLTEKVMKDMKLIAEGKKLPEEGLAEVAQLVRDDIDVMMENGIAMRKNLGVSHVTPSPDDYVNGTFDGEMIKFKRIWSGHEFTDDEIKKLLEKQDIVIEVNGSNGTYFVKGHLSKQNYKGKIFHGFERVAIVDENGSEKSNEKDLENYAYGTWKGKEIKFKRVWSGHKFTDSEVESLLKGEEISFEATSSKGTTYTAKGKLANQSFNGIKFVGFKPDFK